MRTRAHASLAVWLALAASPALAQPVEPDESPTAPDEDPPEADEEQEKVSGNKLPPLDLDAIKEPREASMDYQIPTDLTIPQYSARPYGQSTYLGAQALKLDPDFVYAVQQGMEKLYLRDYSEAREHFAKVEEKYPGTGVASVADLLVWQALMLENFDFRFDKQYWVSSKAARADLEKAIEKPGNEGWEHFLMAGVVGIEAIHTTRHTQYIQALQLAFSAMDHIEKARAAAPEFLDIRLADGMYNYWRTVMTMSSKVLPDFGDKRVEGLEQMQAVEKGGVFLSSPATLSLAFSWLEEGEYHRALQACGRNRASYPKSIINNLVTGTTYIYMRRYDTALEVLGDILKEDPENKRVRYWLGLAHLRMGNEEAAEKELLAYLGTEHLEDWQRSNAHYRLGQVYSRKKEYAKAHESYQAAVKADGHKSAKKSLDRMQERKKAGKIDY